MAGESGVRLRAGLRPTRTCSCTARWARLLTAILLTAAGYAILRSGTLPRWTGRLAYAVAIVNLAFVPSLFFGTDAADFYSAVGWGNTAMTAALVVYWALAVGITVLKRSSRPLTRPA
ncbi:hypothetical protein [Streptomyces solicathayae]|uniref:Integral membrane protein n=1 Tax=Streptomyces solicathayae TaxID=3081768 RepID=A0ABZ0LVH0_9ACTN|nr:hypothetical protein [Streptomyces sp. HUAS YS2]WOX23500.1 hypothetical protein R2D22_19790 [Streptomyces sp. HUAS YS2]